MLSAAQNCIAEYYLFKYMKEHNGELPTHAHILVKYCKHAISWIDAHEIIVQYIYEEGNKFTQFNEVYLKLLSSHFTHNGISQKSLLEFHHNNGNNQNIPMTNSSNNANENIYIKQSKTDITLNCKSIHKCNALQRITMMLHFFHANKINNEKELIYHCNNTYITIESDYNHLINEHLTSFNKQQTINNYNIIHKQITKFVQCDETKCNKHIKHNIHNIKQNKQQFYIHLLDTIHCYFVHKYNVSHITIQQKSKNIDIINIDKEQNVASIENTATDNQIPFNQHYKQISVCSEETKLSNDQETLSKHSESKMQPEVSYSDGSNTNDTDNSNSLNSEDIIEIWHQYKTNLNKIFYCFAGYDNDESKKEIYMTLNDIIGFLEIVEINEYWSVDEIFNTMNINKDKNKKINVITLVEFFCDENINSKAIDIKTHIEKRSAWKLLLRAVEIFEKLDVDHCGQLGFDKFKQFGIMLGINDKETEVLYNSIDSDQSGYITIIELFEWLKMKMEIVKHGKEINRAYSSESDDYDDSDDYSNDSVSTSDSKSNELSVHNQYIKQNDD